MIDPIIQKIFILSSLSFVLALILSPVLTEILYRYRIGKQIRNDKDTPNFTNLHKGKEGTPTMGGILVWGVTAFLCVFFWSIDKFFDISFFNFLNRRETLLALGAMIFAALVGFIDDFLDVRRRGHKGRGIRFRVKIFFYGAVALAGSYWMYFKLGMSSVYIPSVGDVDIGWLFIPLFIFIVIGTSFAVNLTDGLDGLAGGLLSISFVVFAVISYLQNRPNLAVFLAVVVGALLAFLWFNIHPARYFMGDTGSMALGMLLAIVAFQNNVVYLLPVVGFVFVVEALSVLVQIFSKALFKKKVFLSAPIHHHFEMYGWPETKVTMRFWVIGAVCALLSMVIYL